MHIAIIKYRAPRKTTLPTFIPFGFTSEFGRK
jgi:hypothetical protein